MREGTAATNFIDIALLTNNPDGEKRFLDSGSLHNRFGRWVADAAGIGLDDAPRERIAVGGLSGVETSIVRPWSFGFPADEKLQPAHPGEVVVEGPHRRLPIHRDGPDEQVGEPEALASGTSTLRPIVDAAPRAIGREQERQRRQRPSQARPVVARGTRQQLDTYRRRKCDLVRVEEPG
jgi:hypothetical protein